MTVVSLILATLLACGTLAEEPLPLPAPDGVESAANELTLLQLEEMALTHPAIAEAAAKVRAARGKWIQAGLYPNPVFGYMGSEIGNEGRGGQQGGFLEQEYVTAGKLTLAEQTACWEIRLAEQKVARAQMRVLSEVHMRYYETIIAQRAVTVVGELRKATEEGLKLTEDRKAAQEVSEVDVLQSRYEAQAAHVLALQTETELIGARRRLEAALGGITLTDLRITDEIDRTPEPMTWEFAWSQVLGGSPELAAARLNVERARWELRRQIALRIPNITFQASVQDDHATGDTVAGATIGVPLPIYNCNQGNIEQARGELSVAEQAVGRLEAELQGKLATVYREYQSALQQADRYRMQMLPDADRALQLVRMAYASGEVDYLRLLSTQQNYGRAHLAYLKALETVWTRQAMIEGFLTARD